jgi:ATP sulfurylase
MQQARSAFFNGLRSVSGSIFNMPSKYFVSKYDRASVKDITDLVGWTPGKGKEYDVLKAPVFYPDHAVNAKKIFSDWEVLAKVTSLQPEHPKYSCLWKVIKVAVCGKMSLFPKGRGGPPSYAKIWKLTTCTPGMIAFGVTSVCVLITLLSNSHLP